MIRRMGEGPGDATRILSGARILGTVTQEAGQLRLRSGLVGDLPLAFSAATNVGAFYDGTNLLLVQAGVSRLSAGNPARAVAAFTLDAGLRVDGEATKTGAYTVNGTDAIVPVSTTGGAVTITLPAAPGLGQMVTVKDVGGNAAMNNITVARNGKNIDGAALDKTIATNYGVLRLWYDGTAWWSV